jgi:membrane protein
MSKSRWQYFARSERWDQARIVGITRWHQLKKSRLISWLDNLNELGFVRSCIAFGGLFVISFLPFLLLVSAALGSDLPHAVSARSQLSPAATTDITALFAHKGGGVTSQSIIGVIVVILGAESLARNLQTWYARVYTRDVGRWRAQIRRLWWIGGAFGFVALQYVIARHVHSTTQWLPQLTLAVGFWWWSLHCLLDGSLPWGRLFAGGLTTAALTTTVGILFSNFGSPAITSSQKIYGPIGTVTVLLEVLIGLGVAIHLGALLGAGMPTAGASGDGPSQRMVTRP